MVSALIPQFSSGLRVRNINFPFQRAAFPSKMSRGGVRLGISGFRLWNHDLGFYKKTGNQKKISILETPTSDFAISLLNRFLDKPRKDTVCSREQCLTVVFCGPFSANYARACKTAFLVRKVFQILSQISTHKIKTKCK